MSYSTYLGGPPRQRGNRDKILPEDLPLLPGWDAEGPSRSPLVLSCLKWDLIIAW